jgi:8-oxo-dGTP pyrophosphatase MutT (NUDIX family)
VTLDPQHGPSVYADLATRIGISRERASSVCVHDAQLLCVRLRDPTTRVVRCFVPGGAIEPSETPEQAAIRETVEETGYEVARDRGDVQIARYPFDWNGQLFAVTTHFVRVRLIDPSRPPAVVNDATYLEGVTWLALADVPREFAFLPEMRDAVLNLIADG